MLNLNTSDLKPSCYKRNLHRWKAQWEVVAVLHNSNNFTLTILACKYDLWGSCWRILVQSFRNFSFCSEFNERRKSQAKILKWLLRTKLLLFPFCTHPSCRLPSTYLKAHSITHLSKNFSIVWHPCADEFLESISKKRKTRTSGADEWQE